MTLSSLATPDDMPWSDRRHQEVEEDFRSSYQRDRDCILHSDSFRKLQHKTQVFVVQEGDFFRTRLTHTLEVAQIARSLAVGLGLNEALAEAIALGHDLGHGPFGHTGEEALRDFLKLTGREWNANAHSLTVADELEVQHPGYPGLNLTWAVREGLARHNTKFDVPTETEEFGKYEQPSLEAQVVNKADVVAYATHDVEDAVLAGLIDLEELHGLRIQILSESWSQAKRELGYSGTQRPRGSATKLQLLVRRTRRHLINRLVRDILDETERRVSQATPHSLIEARSLCEPLVALSPEIDVGVDQLLEIMLERVYKGPTVARQNHRARHILRHLYNAIIGNPKLLPVRVQEHVSGKKQGALLWEAACFLAGLTDRTAVDLYAELFEPSERSMGHRIL